MQTGSQVAYGKIGAIGEYRFWSGVTEGCGGAVEVSPVKASIL